MLETDQKAYMDFPKMAISDTEKTNTKLFFFNPQLAVVKPDLVLAISPVSDRLVHGFQVCQHFILQPQNLKDPNKTTTKNNNKGK